MQSPNSMFTLPVNTARYSLSRHGTVKILLSKHKLVHTKPCRAMPNWTWVTMHASMAWYHNTQNFTKNYDSENDSENDSLDGQ